MGTIPIHIIIDHRLDWYSSVTCSDVKWFEDVIRDPNTRTG